MRNKIDARNLRKSGNQIVNTIAIPDSSRVQRNVKLEPTRSLETSGVAAGFVVLLNDEDLESLAREGRCATQPAKAGTNDDGIELVGAFHLPMRYRQRTPIEHSGGKRSNQCLNELATLPLRRRHKGPSSRSRQVSGDTSGSGGPRSRV